MASALLSGSPSAMETSPLFLGGILVVCVLCVCSLLPCPSPCPCNDGLGARAGKCQMCVGVSTVLLRLELMLSVPESKQESDDEYGETVRLWGLSD